MHPLLGRVLEQRQLAAAGQLFALNHYDLLTDLHTALQRIKDIFDDPKYAENGVDQSVVEIVVARITAAIRETSTTETYSAELVDVLDSCLRHRMTALNENGEYIDSPHCKIANDLLSCLFLNYSKRSVMTLVLPVAVKALGSANDDLVKSTSSYISLAAIHNGKPLAQFAIQIISHIINGNHSLLRVLPQIYEDNREPFHAHLAPLLHVLEDSEADCSEKLSLLQLASMIANYKPDLLAPYLPQFEHFLSSPATCTAVLNVYMSLVSQAKARLLAPFLPALKEISAQPTCQTNLATICKIVGSIGRVSLPLASEALEELLRIAQIADFQLLPSVLIEIEGVVASFPTTIRPHLEALKAFSTTPTNGRVVERIIALTGVSSRASHSGESAPIMIAKNSSEPLLNRNNPVIVSGSRTLIPVGESSTLELDRNTHTLAMQYQNRSSGSLSRMHSRSGASVSGRRSASENVNGSRELSQTSIAGSSSRVPSDFSRPPHQKTQTLPASFAPDTHIQIGKDGRVRPVSQGRRPARWPAGSYETTFPANSDPVTTTKMHPLNEEDEAAWNMVNDRSDVVLQFVDHRRNKIRRYIAEVTSHFPVPIQCTVEGSKRSKHRMLVHFGCQTRSQYCLFSDDNLFAIKTKQPGAWLHLMFLQMQCSSLDSIGIPVAKASNAYQTLERCWQCLPPPIHKDRPFVNLVTSAFPPPKDQELLLKELDEACFFSCFAVDQSTNRWSCFSCSHPERVKSFIEDGSSVKMLEGQLKEKKGRWWFLRRWHTKYFTLSSAALSYSTPQHTDASAENPAIDLRQIRSVRSLGRGKKNRKSLRRAFEIFTSDNSSVVLKATDEKQAEEWMQCLQIAVAHAKRVE